MTATRISRNGRFKKITSNNPELGDAKEELEVTYKGTGLKIGFNAKYIMDVLTSIDDTEIAMDLKDQLSPGVMRPNADKDYTCVKLCLCAFREKFECFYVR